MTNLDTGSNTGPFLAPGLDSIAEIKVLTSNYQAEYGRSSGGTINVVTKSGSRDFHGGGFYSKRDERLQRQRVAEQQGRPDEAAIQFDYSGYNIGGPIVLPAVQQRAQQAVLLLEPGVPAAHQSRDPERRTMPTELERRGDFSQSLDTNGRLIVIRDPATGQPFPGNIIPTNRIDANGQALLNLFPVPNANDPTASITTRSRAPSSSRATIRCCASTGTSGRRPLFYSRLNFGYEAFKGGWGFVLNNANWPQLPIAYEIHSYGVVNTLLHTFSPTTVIEVTVGLNHGKQTVEPLTPADLERNDRTQVGLSGLPQFFPEANPSRIVPNVNFGAAGLRSPTCRQLGVEGRYPFFGENDIWNSSVNLTKVPGSHNLKAGLFYEYTTRPAARSQPVQRHVQLQPQHEQPARHQPPVRQRAARIGAQLLRGDLASRCQRAVHQRRVVPPGQLARGKNLTIDAGHPLLPHRADQEPGDQLAVFIPERYNAAARRC